jgi:ribonuclease-3
MPEDDPPADKARFLPRLDDSRVAEIQEALGYRFRNPDLLFQALVHSSARDHALGCNERMEFLGDAILGMIVSRHLFATQPDLEEGDLSKIKSVVVSSASLASVARRLRFSAWIVLGKGVLQKKPLPDSVLANVLEAVIAAVYLDGGLAPAEEFTLRLLSARISAVLEDRYEKNFKSLLQQFTQRELGAIPAYRVVSESGPDHEKQFAVVVEFDRRVYGPGIGGTKKDAEQQAARLALEAVAPAWVLGSKADAHGPQ